MSDKNNLQLIKKLRDETGASIFDIREAVEEAEGDEKKASELLKKKSAKIAAKKADRETGEGIVYAYIHANNKVGVLVQLSCETDFVAKTTDFVDLAKEISLQIAAMDPENVEELLDMDYVRDSGKKIKDLVEEVVGKLGENIQVTRFVRYSI